MSLNRKVERIRTRLEAPDTTPCPACGQADPSPGEDPRPTAILPVRDGKVIGARPKACRACGRQPVIVLAVETVVAMPTQAAPDAAQAIPPDLSLPDAPPPGLGG